MERGVRFVTLFNGAFAMGEGNLNWDGHRRIQSDYERHGPILDQAAAALLIDLKARGLLDDTLVLWTTEFGRMPTFQKGAEGRDHNPEGFTAWMAGAGVKRAHSHGATDEFGHRVVEDVADMHDFHATILHLLGLDHERLTFPYNGVQSPADRRAWSSDSRRSGLRCCPCWSSIALLAVAVGPPDFERDVAPLIASRCVRCHNEATAKGGLSLASAAELREGGDSGPAVEPGHPDESLLLEQVGGEKPAMPRGGEPLSASEVGLLRDWIAQWGLVAGWSRP